MSLQRPSADVLRIAEKLIGFDTVSANSNLALIDWIRDYLDRFGVKSSLIFDETGRKANLFASIGPADKSGFVLSGHTDVVPVAGQNWSSDPFSMVERDGRLYGRGACDMKSFIAVALAAVPQMKATRLARPLHLCFSYDEEVGCRGAPSLVEHMKLLETPPLVCVIGEPTDMNVVIAHKGNVRYRCVVAGHECHSALTHLGANAVEAAAQLVGKLKSMANRMRELGPFDHAFDPPYTTVHTGNIRGGTALNIVPNECQFEFEIRYLPQDDPVELLDEIRTFSKHVIEPEMRQVSQSTGVNFIFKSELAGLNTDQDSEAARLVMEVAHRTTPSKISFGTEGGLFGQAHIRTVVCGPGSIEQAHKPDEWVALDQLHASEMFVGRLIMRAAS